MSQQPIRYRRDDSLNNESSQEKLDKLFSAIMQWRDKYDPNNEIFDQAWYLANEKYKSQHKLIPNKSTIANTTEIKEAEPSPVTQGTQVTKDTQVAEECDNDDFDPTQDSKIWSDMEKMKEKELKNVERETEAIKKITKCLNDKAKAFVPHSQILNLSNPEIPLISNIMIAIPLPLPPPPPLPLLPYLLPNINLISNMLPCIWPLPLNQNISINNQQFVTQQTQRKTDCNKIFEFEPKCTNHAKGNFFIAHEETKEMMAKCMESFHTKRLNDEKLAFGYFKESVAMQINDNQINIIRTLCGDIIIINIDLHFANGGDIMYVIAMENDIEYRDNVKWKIIDFMSADMIYKKYRLTTKILPKSSRNMPQFRYALNNPPKNISYNVIKNVTLKDLPCKDPNKKKGQMYKENKIINISESCLKYYCYESWNNGIMIPVVVVKGKNQWIEWKKPIKIYDENNKEEWIGISLRYDALNNKWEIVCLDYDLGRVFYQHRLVGTNHNYCYSFNDLIGYITTSLNIY